LAAKASWLNSAYYRNPIDLGARQGALTVAGQWRSFTAFPSILNELIYQSLDLLKRAAWLNSTNLLPGNGGEVRRRIKWSPPSAL
jgi:hypothetical protein